MNGKIQEKKYTLNVSVEKPFHFQRKKKKAWKKETWKKILCNFRKNLAKIYRYVSIKYMLPIGRHLRDEQGDVSVGADADAPAVSSAGGGRELRSWHLWDRVGRRPRTARNAPVHGNANHILKPIHTRRLGEAAWSLRLQPSWSTMWDAQASSQSTQHHHLHAGSVRICSAWRVWWNLSATCHNTTASLSHSSDNLGQTHSTVSFLHCPVPGGTAPGQWCGHTQAHEWGGGVTIPGDVQEEGGCHTGWHGFAVWRWWADGYTAWS